jgi:hypothetical protein
LSDSLTVRLISDKPSTGESWLPSIIAIVVVILGGVIQWAIANRQWKEQRQALDRQLETQRELTERQIDASLHASARLRWIGDVRRVAAQIMASATMQLGAISQLNFWNHRTVSPENLAKANTIKGRLSDEMVRRRYRLARLTQELRLFLNPDEPIQHGLAQATALLDKVLSSGGGQALEAEKLTEDFTSSVSKAMANVSKATVIVVQHYWPKEREPS